MSTLDADRNGSPRRGPVGVWLIGARGSISTCVAYGLEGLRVHLRAVPGDKARTCHKSPRHHVFSLRVVPRGTVVSLRRAKHPSELPASSD